MIDDMAAVKPPLTSREAVDRCHDLSYPTIGKAIHAYAWTGEAFQTLRGPSLPFVSYPKCSADYVGKDNCAGEHHMHGDKNKLVCCLCGWEWTRDREQALNVLYTCLFAKLLRDELGF